MKKEFVKYTLLLQQKYSGITLIKLNPIYLLQFIKGPMGDSENTEMHSASPEHLNGSPVGASDCLTHSMSGIL